MSAQPESRSFTRVKWGLRKLASLFLIYAALGSLFKAIQANSVAAIVVYLLLGAVGLYLLGNW